MEYLLFIIVLFCEFGPVFFPAFFVVQAVALRGDAQAGGAVEFYLKDRRDGGRSFFREISKH